MTDWEDRYGSLPEQVDEALEGDDAVRMSEPLRRWLKGEMSDAEAVLAGYLDVGEAWLRDVGDDG